MLSHPMLGVDRHCFIREASVELLIGGPFDYRAGIPINPSRLPEAPHEVDVLVYGLVVNDAGLLMERNFGRDRLIPFEEDAVASRC